MNHRATKRGTWSYSRGTVLGALSVLLAVLVPPALRADVTARYTYEVKVASPLLAQAQQTIRLAHVIRVKGNRAYWLQGSVARIVDLSTGEVTLVDPESQSFATLPVKQYVEMFESAFKALRNSPANVKVPASVKVRSEFRVTDRTEVIQGVQTQEREFTVYQEMPPPGGAGAGTSSRMLMRFWVAKPEEILRVPGLRELAGFDLWRSYFMNPKGMFLGGSRDLEAAFEPLDRDKPLALREYIATYLPSIAEGIERAWKEGTAEWKEEWKEWVAEERKRSAKLAGDFDPNAPISEVTVELTELSSTPVDDAVFRVPEGYKAASADDLMRKLVRPPVPAPAPPNR